MKTRQLGTGLLHAKRSVCSRKDGRTVSRNKVNSHFSYSNVYWTVHHCNSWRM